MHGRIFLGTYQIKPKHCSGAITTALQLGYRHFDCAPIYFNEVPIGDELNKQFSNNDEHSSSSSDNRIVSRQDVFINSKLASPFHKREDVKIGLKKTLSDLRLDYLDSYIIHWPQAFHFVDINPQQRGYDNEDIGNSDGGQKIDTSVSIHETWEGMEELVKEGLVKSIGVSNFTVSLLHELMTQCRIPPAINQVEIHPYLQQQKLLDYCNKRNVHVQAYSPLGSPGHVVDKEGEPQILQDPILLKIANAHKVTVAQVCIAWALQRGTSVVVKSTSPQRQKENFILEKGGSNKSRITLSRDDMQEIESLDRGYRFFRPEDWWDRMAVFH